MVLVKAFPWGEGAPVRTLGRMRATLLKELVVYQRNTARYRTLNPIFRLLQTPFL